VRLAWDAVRRLQAGLKAVGFLLCSERLDVLAKRALIALKGLMFSKNIMDSMWRSPICGQSDCNPTLRRLKEKFAPHIWNVSNYRAASEKSGACDTAS
jgi:hypothetical protein